MRGSGALPGPAGLGSHSADARIGGRAGEGRVLPPAPGLAAGRARPELGTGGWPVPVPVPVPRGKAAPRRRSPGATPAARPLRPHIPSERGDSTATPVGLRGPRRPRDASRARTWCPKLSECSFLKGSEPVFRAGARSPSARISHEALLAPPSAFAQALVRPLTWALEPGSSRTKGQSPLRRSAVRTRPGRRCWCGRRLLPRSRPHEPRAPAAPGSPVSPCGTGSVTERAGQGAPTCPGDRQVLRLPATQDAREPARGAREADS